MAATKQHGPVFLRFVVPTLDTLREFGNSGAPAEVTDRVIERCKITAREQDEVTSNGQSRVRNQIAWARFHMVKAGLLDASQRGVWTLTEAGRKARLDPDGVYKMFKQVRGQFSPKADAGIDSAKNGSNGEGVTPVIDDYPTELLQVLRALPPSGFERVCQRLLRESGFQQVVVTGRSNDGGIDGHGVLEINPLVTFKVLFQCKRYKDGSSVAPSQVRDFRGAMQGRADKGLILTTSTFSVEARKEATRDGAPPIELIDGEKLVTMFERAGIGLRARQTYDVDHGFFAEFRG